MSSQVLYSHTVKQTFPATDVPEQTPPPPTQAPYQVPPPPVPQAQVKQAPNPAYIDEEEAERLRIIPYLTNQSYHIPPNGWWKDWKQYMKNTHPIIGIWFHHKYHPIQLPHRLVILVASISFGLAMTNAVFLYFVLNRKDMDEILIQIQFNHNATATTNTIPSDYSSVEITTGMVALWTVGGYLHAMFDSFIWTLAACACCQPGGSLFACFGRRQQYDHHYGDDSSLYSDKIHRWVGCGGACVGMGFYLVYVLAVVVVSAATSAVVLRASLESNKNNRGDYDDDGMNDENNMDYAEFGPVEFFESFQFLVGYAIELVLALLIYNPIHATLQFSGILGCFRLPMFGGRPREVYLLKKKKQMEEQEGRGWVEDDVPC